MSYNYNCIRIKALLFISLSILSSVNGKMDILSVSFAGDMNDQLCVPTPCVQYQPCLQAISIWQPLFSQFECIIRVKVMQICSKQEWSTSDQWNYQQIGTIQWNILLTVKDELKIYVFYETQWYSSKYMAHYTDKKCCKCPF